MKTRDRDAERRRRTVILAVSALVAALAAACGGRGRAAEPVGPVAPPTPEQVVAAGKQVVEQWRQAWAVRSPEALGALYVQGLDVVVVVQGTPYRGWSAVEAYQKDLIARAQTFEVKVSDVTVVALGVDGASVTAQVERRYGDGVTTFQEEGPLTLALARVDGEWRIVSEHFSFTRDAR